MDPRIIKKRKLEIEIDDGDHTEARRSEEVGVLSEKKRKMEGEGGDEPRGTDRQDRLVSEDGKGRAIGIDIMGTNNKVLEKGKGEDRPRVVGNGTARLEGSVVPSKTGTDTEGNSIFNPRVSMPTARNQKASSSPISAVSALKSSSSLSATAPPYQPSAQTPSSPHSRSSTSTSHSANGPATSSSSSSSVKPAVHSFFAPRSASSTSDMAQKVRKVTRYGKSSLEHWVWGEGLEDFEGSKSVKKNTAKQTSKGTGTKPQVKLALYDLDGTLISTRTGYSFPKDEYDWKWWDVSVKRKLSAMHKLGYDLVVISNQKLKAVKLDQWRKKIGFICRDLPEGLPMRVLAATGDDEYRKPRIGMFDILEEIYADRGMEIDVLNSFYVGDAAGRNRDHNDTDKKWAINAGLKFLTPEEHFKDLEMPASRFNALKGFDAKKMLAELNLAPLVTPTTTPLIPEDTREIVLFVGYPASGKTSFFQTYFQPKGYIHVNQDTLRTRDKCLASVRHTIESGKTGCVVDNTNRDRSTRALYITMAKQLGVPIRCLYFTSGFALARHNNAYRAWCAKNVPSDERRTILDDSAFASFKGALQIPDISEGFDEVRSVNFKFVGNHEEKQRWSRWMH